MLIVNELREDRRRVVHEDKSSTITIAPLNKLLVHTSMPATTPVAINLCGEDSAEEIGETVNEKKRDILNTFKRRAFNRISFNGESGPLLRKMEATKLERRRASAVERIHHLGEKSKLSELRRTMSQVSMRIIKATTSGEATWHEELLKYRQARFSSRRVRKRVVFKHGDCNVVQGNVAKRRRRYLQDIFTTLVDAQWRWTLLVFSMNFLLSWLGFALIWWLIAYSHGDLDLNNYNNHTFIPCVEDIRSFTSCFLFSVETQHTIGYGAKHTTDECPEAIFTLCIQSMTGVILQAFMVGIVFAKLSRPQKRTQTLLFSRNAVIYQRDGQLCLMFRVGDMRKSHIIEAHVRAQMIKRKVTKEGELLPFFQTELKVGDDGEEDKIFFIWPTTIVHKIDRHSPLYRISASDMLQERFEIVVILEGVIESTGMTTQARSSYLPSEILWGHRFQSIISFHKETGEYEVNYSLFNNTYEVDTPLCSAADLDRIRAIHYNTKAEHPNSSPFPEYRETSSSSSLTITSGSSLGSSTGGLHMQMPTPTPANPIPVLITAPDGSCRRESINMHSDMSQSHFYAQNEITKEEHDIENSKDQNYDRVLKNINASLGKSKKQNDKENRMQQSESKTTLDSRKSEKASSKSLTDHSRSITEEDQISDLKKLSCRSNPDIRQRNLADSTEIQYPSTSRRSSLCDDYKVKNVFKKTSFIFKEKTLANCTDSQNTSLTEQR